MNFGFMMPNGRFTRIRACQLLSLFDATYGLHSDADINAIDTTDRYRLTGSGGKFDCATLSANILLKSEYQWKSVMMAMNLTMPTMFAIRAEDLPLMPSYGVLLATDNTFVRYDLKDIVDRTGIIGDPTGPIRPFDISGLMLANGRFVPIVPHQIRALYHKKIAWSSELPAESRKRAASGTMEDTESGTKKRSIDAHSAA
jgi:hypothetical protein